MVLLFMMNISVSYLKIVFLFDFLLHCSGTFRCFTGSTYFLHFSLMPEMLNPMDADRSVKG